MPFWSIEPLLRKLRNRRIIPHLPLGGVYIDIGCDTPPLLIDAVKEHMDFCIGIDAEVNNSLNGNVELRRCMIKKRIPVEPDLANVVTMLAVLEHMDYPRAVAKECYRILKPGGTLLVTVPSPKNKRLLEFLAIFGFVRKTMIEQHKNYFTPSDLTELFLEAGFRSVNVTLFQFGLNTFMMAVK